MSWQDRLLNINCIDIEKSIKEAIKDTKDDIKGLSLERMCQVYTSYLFESLKRRHLIVRIINTKDLGLDFEHFFILVNDNVNGFYLCDLTFSQFNSDYFPDILRDGYQKITSIELNEYLTIVGKKEPSDIELEDLFYFDNYQNKKR